MARLLRTGLVTARAWKPSSWNGAYRKVEEANGSGRRQEEIGGALTLHGTEQSRS